MKWEDVEKPVSVTFNMRVPNYLQSTGASSCSRHLSSRLYGALTFTRTLVLRPMVVPADEYPALKDFADKVGGADQAQVVLIGR